MDDQDKTTEEITDTAEAQAPVVDDAENTETQEAQSSEILNQVQDDSQSEAQDDIPEPELNADKNESGIMNQESGETAEEDAGQASMTESEETAEVEEPAQERNEIAAEPEAPRNDASGLLPDNDEVATESPVTEEAKTEDVVESFDSAQDKEAVADPDAVPENPNAVNGKWYVIHTFAGHENRVATAIKQRVEAEHLEDFIFDVLVPTQDKIEIRGGKKETVKEKIFPGYILVKMILSDESWLAVRTTQGVTSFVGAGNKPTPVSNAEVNSIVKFTTQGAQPTFKDVFMVDDTVKIIDGPFSEFIGKVDSVDKEKGRVRVLVSIFGRETPVELDFLQVQKL